jgi:hypothetical protein
MYQASFENQQASPEWKTQERLGTPLKAPSPENYPYFTYSPSL